MKVGERVPTTALEITDIICDLCGKSCWKGDPNNRKDGGFEYAELLARWGYYSDNKDTDKWECHICEDCCDKLPFKNKIRVIPGL